MATVTMKGLGNDNHCTYHSIDSSSSNRNTYGLLNDYLFFATLLLYVLVAVDTSGRKVGECPRCRGPWQNSPDPSFRSQLNSMEHHILHTYI
jgi:hypothetical protein